MKVTLIYMVAGLIGGSIIGLVLSVRGNSCQIRELEKDVGYIEKDISNFQQAVDELSTDIYNLDLKIKLFDTRMRHSSASLVTKSKMISKLGQDLEKALAIVESSNYNGNGDKPVTIIGESPDPEKDQDGNIIFPLYERVGTTNTVPRR